MKRLWIALALVLIVLPGAAWSTNLNFEGGFAGNGIANGWSDLNKLDGFFTTPVTSGENTIVHPGGSVWSQKIEAAAEGGIYQVVSSLDASKLYVVTAYVYLAYPGAVTWFACPQDNWVELDYTGDWQKVTWTGRPSDAGQLMIELDGVGAFYYDDVSVVEVPTEPVLPASSYYKIYNETSELVGGGNIYFCGGVFDGKLYTGQNAQCAQLWGDEQVSVPVQSYDTWDGLEWVPSLTTDFSARVKMTQPWMPVGTYGPFAWGRPVAKCSVPLGGYIYMAGGGTAMFRAAGWWTGTSQPQIDQISTPGGEIVDCICTDGQYIFAATWSPTAPERVNKIYKYAVNQATGALTNVSGWPVTVAGTTGFTGISYYGGKIYAVDSGSPYGIYEISAASGAATKLANFVYPNAGGNDTQVVRYGNQLFITCAALDCHKLYTYTLNAGVWTATSSYVIATDDAGIDKRDVYGVAVKGDGTTAKYAWVTAEGSTMFFLGLTDPWASSPIDLKSATLKTGHRVNVNNAVVTAAEYFGGFWIESRDRNVATHVVWTDGLPPAVGTLVSVKGIAGKTSAGERTLTAIGEDAVTAGDPAVPAVLPLGMTNRSLASALSGAGLANDGMLVTIYGKVTHYEASTGAFYLDDGSGVQSDIEGIKGVKILKADTYPMDGVTNFSLVTGGHSCCAKVTGVVRLEKLIDGSIIRRLDARSDDDVKIIAN